ncbi:MAG: 2-phospho-L-lactate transferase [Proteobacteria bacterium]|nr:2-phospho-L-lactate transferase [Pseudomonadota bacterium]
MSEAEQNQKWVALCGGIGGAKLALGLMHVLAPEQLTIVVNTGDDFRHLGLHVSPDIDTVLYTLAGLSNRELGWGLEGETWSFMEAMARLGGPTWFQLGDQDLATHALRTTMLSEGRSLSEVTRHLGERLGVKPAIVPMSDDPVATVVETEDGTLAFQTYFVGRRCEPKLKAVRFEGAKSARMTPGAKAALADPQLAGILICPSNPWLSVDPLLAIPEWRRALDARHVPCVAVSPLVGGRAVKGPTAKIMGELGLPLHAGSIAAHYQGLIDGLVLDTSDAEWTSRLDVRTAVTKTLMVSLDDRIDLAKATLDLARQLRKDNSEPFR